MIRQLAQCPYCQGCEIALTDSPAVAFNPGANPAEPCTHLMWVDGRYSQYQLDPLAGRRTKIARLIGSTEFEWAHPHLTASENADQVQAFVKELAANGAAWELAPPEVHSVLPIERDQSVTEADGKQYPSWQVEGAAVFARDPAAFVRCLPACLGRQSATLEQPFNFDNP